MMRAGLVLALAIGTLAAADRPARKVDPSFLRRSIEAVEEKAADGTSDSCRYKPLFGAGDAEASTARGMVRFGVLTLAPGGECNPVSYPAEEQVYVISAGSGTLHYGATTAPVKPHDFMYLPAGVRHWLSASSGSPVRLFVMGFSVKQGTPPPSKLLIANYDDVRKEHVEGHPESVVYQLMMGGVESTRDRIAAGHRLTSLYLMELQPNGTNFPHHHDDAEEIYVLLDGAGDMAAGSGMDGVEGRFPSRAGDAWFFRLNCTVGFYNGGGGIAHVLAVRSLYPR